MNRLSHLFKDTKLIVTAKKGTFYRVMLSKTKAAWISINSVDEYLEPIDMPKFVTTNSESYKNALVQTIEFTEKLYIYVFNTARKNFRVSNKRR